VSLWKLAGECVKLSPSLKGQHFSQTYFFSLISCVFDCFSVLVILFYFRFALPHANLRLQVAGQDITRHLLGMLKV